MIFSDRSLKTVGSWGGGGAKEDGSSNGDQSRPIILKRSAFDAALWFMGKSVSGYLGNPIRSKSASSSPQLTSVANKFNLKS